MRVVRALTARRRRALRVALALVTILGALAARPAAVATGPRDVRVATAHPLADRWRAPEPHTGPSFATLPATHPDGRRGTWVVADRALPLRFVVEEQVVQRYGLDAVSRALEAWNDTPGSRFSVEVVGVADTRIGHRARDGVSRVFLDTRDCGDTYLARSHLFPGARSNRGGVVATYLDEVDVGICERMTAERLPKTIRHEVAHAAGLGHLCDPGAECHELGMGAGHACRVMYPEARACQEPDAGDAAALVHLHPKLPRVGGGNALRTVAAVSYLDVVEPRSQVGAVVADTRTDPGLVLAAVALAGVRGVPFLLVDSTCTSGVDGDELDRVLQVNAGVTIVGEASPTCVAELSRGWDLDVDHLEDHDAVAVAAVQAASGRTVVVVGSGDRARSDAAVAAPLAARLGAPLLHATPFALTSGSRAALDAMPEVSRAVLVGGTRSMTRLVTADLQDRGLMVERVHGDDRVATALALLDAFPVERAVLAPTTPGTAAAAASLAVARGAAVVLTRPEALDPRVEAALAGITGGYTLGDREWVGDGAFLAANRALG